MVVPGNCLIRKRSADGYVVVLCVIQSSSQKSILEQELQHVSRAWSVLEGKAVCLESSEHWGGCGMLMRRISVGLGWPSAGKQVRGFQRASLCFVGSKAVVLTSLLAVTL